MTIDGSAVLVRGNPAGLRSLARHLLTLAQESVPAGSHLHLTGGSELDGDADLVVERADL
ncbi:Imm32 family immunity protein [Amycolatopsis sp. CA-161197]|uniref:Imm32 family immunity protein n=1 Tax=Amycolatopsis sp. CA-161197 TaxID=3239922 RepID=UPI003D929FCE